MKNKLKNYKAVILTGGNWLLAKEKK